MESNSFKLLNLSPTETMALMKQTAEGRSNALNSLRRYYAILYHPDRNVEGRDKMARINSLIDALIRDPRAACSEPNTATDSADVNWLRAQLEKQRQTNRELSKELETHIARLKGTLGKDRDKWKWKVEGMMGPALEKTQERNSYLNRVVQSYRHKLCQYMPHPSFMGKLELQNMTTEKKGRTFIIVVFRVLRGAVVEDSKAQVGLLMGFLTKQWLSTHKIVTSLEPDLITFRSERFDKVMDGLTMEPAKWCGVVVQRNDCLWVYGRLKKW